MLKFNEARFWLSRIFDETREKRSRDEEKRKEEDGTCSSDHVISLKLERRRRRGRLLIELATSSLRPGLANWHFLFLASKYRITLGTLVRAIQLRLSSCFPFHKICRASIFVHSSLRLPPLFNAPSLSSDGSFHFFYRTNYNRPGCHNFLHLSCHSHLSLFLNLSCCWQVM